MSRDDQETEVQWKVTYFPPDRNDVVRTGTEKQVRKVAELQAEWNPIIETRTITVGEWEIVEDDTEEEE